MIAAAARRRRRAGGRPHRALQSGASPRRGRCVTDPRFIEVHRLGTFPERSLDIDVVFDLMIHDLDVVLSLVDSDVESTRSGRRAGAHRTASTSPTPACASPTAASSNLTASRISRDRVRKIRFFQPSAYVSIDYATQKVEVYRLVKGERADRRRSKAARSPSSSEEPLKRELADFVDAVADAAARRW